MKVLVVFASKNPRKEEMKKYQKIVDSIATTIPNVNLDWYLVEESIYDEIKNKIERSFRG